MTSQDQQIVVAYEINDMPVEEIAETLGYELEAVKISLLQFSKIYYNKAKVERANEFARQTGKSTVVAEQSGTQTPDQQNFVSNMNEDGTAKQAPLFDEQDVTQAKMVISSLMYGEVEAVKFRAARFIIDEAKGRNDLKLIRDVGVPIALINDRIRNARIARERSHKQNPITNHPVMIDV